MWRHQAHHHGSGQGEENALRILFRRVSLLFKSSKETVGLSNLIITWLFRFSFLIRINYVKGSGGEEGYTVRYNIHNFYESAFQQTQVKSCPIIKSSV